MRTGESLGDWRRRTSLGYLRCLPHLLRSLPDDSFPHLRGAISGITVPSRGRLALGCDR